MIRNTKSKYWSIAVINPSVSVMEKLKRRLKRCEFGIYGVEMADRDNCVVEAMFKFKKPVRRSFACRFLREGINQCLLDKVEDISEMLDAIRAYEEYNQYGHMDLDCVVTDLFPDFELEALNSGVGDNSEAVARGKRTLDEFYESVVGTPPPTASAGSSCAPSAPKKMKAFK